MAPASKKRLDPRLRRLVEELHAVRRDKEMSIAEVERRAGMSSKYLYKVLNGYQDLKLKHVYDILDVLEVPYEEFWARLATQRHSLVPVDFTMEELTSHVERIVKRALDGRGGSEDGDEGKEGDLPEGGGHRQDR